MHRANAGRKACRARVAVIKMKQSSTPGTAPSRWLWTSRLLVSFFVISWGAKFSAFGVSPTVQPALWWGRSKDQEG